VPRKCTICIHPERVAIETALADGESYRAIANQFSVSRQAVGRHVKDHIPMALAAAKDAILVASGDSLLEQIESLRHQAQTIKDKAERDGDYRTALAGIRELMRIIELLAKLRGELDERPQVNVLVLPEWRMAQAALLGALEPYPDARVAAALALESIDGSVLPG